MEEILVPYEEILIKRGEVRGEARGEARANYENTLRLIKLLLQEKFGPLSELVLQKLESANLEVLLTWFQRAIKANTLDELWS